MNLYRLATEGIDLDALPLEESQQPRASFQFESSARTPDRLRLPGELDDVFNFAAQEYGVDVDVLRGIAYAESRFNPDIISGKVKSPAGAIGLMQFMPETAKEYGIDPTDPVQSIIGGAAYLRKSLDKFGGDYERAVASYNWGPNRKAYDSEDWASKAPAETQKYLMTVFDAAGRFKDGAGEQTPTPRPETQATPLPAGVAPSSAGGGRGFVSPGDINTKLTRTAVPEMTAGSVARDIASGALQIGPTVVQGVGDLIGLASGNRLGGSVREFAKDGKQAIREMVGSERAQAQAQNLAADMADEGVGFGQMLANNKGALADMVLPTIGSMAIPLGAAGAAGKAATLGKAAQGLDKAALAARVASAQQAAGIGATAAQNAASTFVELLDKGVSVQDAYVGAGITVPFSLIAGKLTGGGAEGALIRGATNPASVVKGAAEMLVKAPVREGAQEGGEALGQLVGESVATETMPTANAALKQVGTEALLGAVMGGGMNAAQQLTAPRVENQPTTPQAPTVTPQAPVTPDAAKTQAVDNIAAAIQEMEGGTNPTALVQPGSQAADAGAAPVAQRATDTSGGLATGGEAVAAGQPEQAQSLTVPEKGSAVIPSAESPTALVQRLMQPATPEQEQTQADTVVAEKAKPAPAYTPAVPQPGQAEAIVGKAMESARKHADLADERLYSNDALQRIAVHPQADAELKSAATNEIARREVIAQRKEQQLQARRSGSVLSIPDAPPLRPLSVERGIEIAKASRDRKLLPQEQGYMDALKSEIGDKAFDLVTRAGKAPFMTSATERKFDLPRLIEQNQSALAAWDSAHNPAQQAAEAPQAAPVAAPKATGLAAEMAAIKAKAQPTVKMDIAPAMQAVQPPAVAPAVSQKATTEAPTLKAEKPVKGKKAAPVDTGNIDTSRQGFTSPTTDVMNSKDSSVAKPSGEKQFGEKGDLALSMPTFKGNKRTMLSMAVSAIKNGMNSKAITQVDDWFGGGGMWSTVLANASLPNVKKIRIAELNPLRIKRIQWMHERGDKLLEDMQRTGALAVYRKIEASLKAEGIVSPSPMQDIGVELAGFSDKTNSVGFKRAMESGAFDLSEEGKVLLAALGDLAFGNRGTKIHDQTRMVAPDGQTVGKFLAKAAFEFARAKQAADQFKSRGGSYEYFPAGSSYELVPQFAQQGENVLSLAAPPYYNTTGYKGAGPFSTGDKWNAVGYAATRDLLKTLVDRQNHVLYTDEAWWLRPDQMDDRNTADGILSEINATIGNLIVAPEKVGNRYEQLGIHNPRAAVRRSVAASAGQGTTRGRDSNQSNRGGSSVDGSISSQVQGGTDEQLGAGRDVPDSAGKVAGRAGGEGAGVAGQVNGDAGIKASRTQYAGTPTTTIRQAITKAYGSLLSRLESKGLVSLTQTEEDAIAAAAQSRADKTGGDVEAIKASLRKSILAQRVWHGTPHRGIEKFSTDKIGTGEGAQAYGWGLYFAAKRDIAEYYRQKLTGHTKDLVSFNGKQFHGNSKNEMMDFAIEVQEVAGLSEKARDTLAVLAMKHRGDMFAVSDDLGVRMFDDSPDAAIVEVYDWINSVDQLNPPAGGQLYEVEIPDDSEMLLWDKPLSEQNESVRDAAMKAARKLYPRKDQYDDADLGRLKGEVLYQGLASYRFGGPKVASQYLASLGIKGIKYLDGQSRNKPLRDVKREFLAELPEDADFAEVMDLLGTGTFSDKNEAVIKALADLDWLGFDYPAQAISTALGNQLQNFDPSPELVQAVAATQDDSTYNYVVFSGDDVQIVDVKYSKDGNLEGFFDPATGKSFLIADNLTAESAPATLMHEVGIHMAADGKLEPLFQRAANLLKMGKGNAFLNRVQNRLDEAGETSNEEAAAYIVTEYEKDRTNAPASVGKWIKDFIADVRAWLFSKGVLLKADSLTVADIAAVARANARSIADGKGWTGYAQKDGAFRFGNTEGQRSKDIATVADAELRKVQERILALSEFSIDPTTGDVSVLSDGSVAEVLRGLGSGASVDSRSGIGEPGSSRAANRSVGGGFKNRQVDARYGDGSVQNNVSGGTGDTASLGDGAKIQGTPVSDSELARYLASTRGGFESHGVGVSTLKRALITRDHGGSADLPGLLYSVDGEGDIRRSVAPKQPVQQTPAVTTWDDLGDSKMDALIFEGQDDRIDLKRVQENIVKAGRQIREEFDARMAETLFPGRVAKRNESFVDQEVKPLLQAMAASNVSMEELGDYLLARHAPERNAQIAKVNPDMPDGGAGTNSQGVLMTTQAANDYIANLSAGKRTALQLLAKRVDAITSGTRDILVTEGLEKASTVAAWEGAYKNYVPLFKDEAAETPSHPIGSGFSVKGGASKRAMGSTKEVTNVLAHVLMQREAAITRAEKNRVGMSLYGLALSNPNKAFWGTVVPKMSTPEIIAELQSMGVNVADAFAGMEATPTIRYVDPNTGLVTERPNPVYKNLDNALVVKVNGEDRVILFNKKNDRAMRLAESLKNQNRGWGSAAPALDAVGKVTRFMASMLTQYNPAFGMVNAVRDVQGALVNLSSTPIKGQQAKVLAAVPAAMKGIARDLRGDKARTQWSDLWVQFQDDGGRTGIRDLISDPYEKAGQIEKDLMRLSKAGKLTPGNAAHAVLDLLSDFNDTLENGVRLAAYKTAIDQGMSRPAAAKLARELTVDFNRKGRTGRELGKLYAFLNASIQGSARTIQTLKGPMGAKIMAGGFALGVLQAFMLAAAGFDDDDIPEFIKSRNLIIPMGGDRYVTIPMALGLHVLPNTGRAVTELIMSGGKDIGEKSLNTIVEIVTAFNPFGGGGDWNSLHGPVTMLAPTVADPLVDLMNNRDFTGRAISKERRPQGDVRPGATMARESTKQSPSGQVYIGISEAINAATGGTDVTKGAVSPTPEQLRYLATVVGGGVYRETERAINAAVLLARGEEVKPHQVPLGSRFAGVLDDEMSTMSRYYKNDEALKKFWSEFKAEAKDGNTARVEEMKRDPRFAAAAMNSKIEQSITKLNKLAGENVSDKEKYESLNKKRAELMKKVNEAVKEAEKQ